MNPLAAVLGLGTAIVQRLIAVPLARALPLWVSPTGLTVARTLLAGILALLLARGMVGPALAVYLLALLTDVLDGALARLRGRTSRFGSRLDPFADKILQGVVFVSFFEAAPSGLGLLLVADGALFVIGLLLVLASRGQERVVFASVTGKWKLALQAVASLLLFWNALRVERAVAGVVLNAVLVSAFFFALLSFFGYFRRALAHARA